MSEHKPIPGSVLVQLDLSGVAPYTAYDTLVCLTEVTKSDTVNTIDASTACGPDKQPGTIEITRGGTGQHLQDPNSGKVSGTSLLIALRAKTTIGWKIGPLAPVEGDEIEEGTGFLSELSSTYGFDAASTFSFTISPFGTPTVEVYSVS